MMRALNFLKNIQAGVTFNKNSWVIGITFLPRTVIFSFLCFDFGIRYISYPIFSQFMLLPKDSKISGHMVYDASGKPEYFNVDSFQYEDLKNDSND